MLFGDHTRVFKFVEFPFVVGADGTHVLVPNKESFDPFFLYIVLTCLGILGRGYDRHFGLLKEHSVVSPPLPEQRAKEATEKVIAPTPEVLVIVKTQGNPGRKVRLHRWGLIPSWAKDPTNGDQLINAQAETVATKPAFRVAFKKR